MCPTSSESEQPQKKKAAAVLKLDTPIQYLKGVGPRIGSILEQKGIKTLGDLINFFPRTYQDRSTTKKITELKPDETALVKGRVILCRHIPIPRLKRPILEAVLQDGTGRISLKWFHYQKGFFESKFKTQPTVFAYGAVKSYNGRHEMVHPDLEFLDEEIEGLDAGDSSSGGGILPIYVEHEGLNQKFLRKIVSLALDAVCAKIPDDLPEYVLTDLGLPPMHKALEQVHRPFKVGEAHMKKLLEFKTTEQERLIFDDFFKFELVVGKRRMKLRKEETKDYSQEKGLKLLEQLKKAVPFELTEDQMICIEKIYEDLSETKPMNRLLQGDVGCGKTMVALASTFPVIAEKGQACILAPTEILASQHYKNTVEIFSKMKLPSGKAPVCELLVGSTTKAKRVELLAALAGNEIQVLIGTHALIEPEVIFNSLGLVVIDEQHRFGVDQRMTLRSKGTSPHMLSMTATPIPRTLALTAYGDLDVSTIKQLPKGRAAIVTKIIKNTVREHMHEAILKELKKGRQAYVIYPLVSESEKIDLNNATEGAEELANGIFSGYTVGLLHGRMKGQEKDDVMNRFKAGKLHVLVSTTVVEVGVDVPNATVMVIENAERFGLSQLHQLRGRIGRGQFESFCYLVPGSAGSSEVAFERLRAMEETRDGFKLAELDLQIRGPGEFLGTKQSGELSFPYANLVRDQDILVRARQAAFRILKDDPDLKKPEHRSLNEYMKNRGLVQQSRLETA